MNRENVLLQSEDKQMPEPGQKSNCLELFDVSKKVVIDTIPLDKIKHMPRAGERIFLPLHQPGDWAAFKIVDIEYFLSTNQRPLDEPGTLRVTVYVEEAK